MIFDLGDHSLETEGQDFYVAENATVLGKVKLCKDASVWFRAVLSCLLYTSPSPRDATLSRMPSSA